MNQPIGIFDSGVGGLSVLKHLEVLLPHQDFIYLADSGYFPYGNKTAEQLKKRSLDIAQFLISKGIQLLVIACHTASANAYYYLKEHINIPVIGMVEPTVEAIKKLELRDLVLLGTEATIRSGIYQKSLGGMHIIPVISPNIIQKIEHNEKVLSPDIKECIGDPSFSILLASTHYSHIAEKIKQEVGPKTLVIDPSCNVAESAALNVTKNYFKRTPTNTFFVTGGLESFKNFLNYCPLRNSSSIFSANI